MRRRTLKIIALTTFVAAVIVAVVVAVVVTSEKHKSSQRGSDDGVVDTDCGPVQGYQNSFLNQQVWAFKGIPYAVPPLGKRRWQPTSLLSQANQCWSGTLDAKDFGDHCYQSLAPNLGILTPGSEDCLFLNVWTPSPKPSTLLPVMVFIHGGSLVIGSGNMLGSSPIRMAANGDVVSVSMNYRLNGFGYLALEELSENDERGVSGNYGLLDQILALHWVKNNIKAFGGDPDRVTIWGQSSGGTSVLLLLISPLASGLFHRAIPMSASPNISVPLSVAEQVHRSDWLQQTRCYNSTNMLDCLYSLSPDEIVNGTTPAWNPMYLFGIPAPTDVISPLPVIDNSTVPLSSWEAFSSGNINDVPIIFGTMAQENDYSPVDFVFNYTDTEYTQFISDKFAPFGVNLGTSVMGLYPISDFETKQLAYESICSDLAVVCGNIDLAQHAAQGVKSPMYLYVTSARPSAPFCYIPSLTYCPRYSFHMFDLFTIDNDWDSWSFTEYETSVSTLIADRFAEFAANGTVSAWMEFNGENYPSTYYTVDLNMPENLENNTRIDKCKLFKDNGLSQFYWQN